jgi:SRSO17 transposase
MTQDELRAAAGELVFLHQRFGPLFGRREAREAALVYLNGLLLGEGRKSAEPLALRFAEAQSPEENSQNRVLALQRFLTASPWPAAEVQREIQAVFAEQVVPAAAPGCGTVGVIDGSGFIKKGKASVGVDRQYCGRLGAIANCQVGVFLVGVAAAGTALLDQQLYLPQGWAQDQERRRKTRVPKEVVFQTKPQIATQLVQRVRGNGLVSLAWVTADEEFGRDAHLLDTLEAQGQRYLMEVPAKSNVWTVDPSTWGPAPSGQRWQRARREVLRSVREVAAALPAEVWQRLQVREGTANPLVFEFARVRVWAVRHRRPGPAIWLLIRRSLGSDPEFTYYVSNASLDVSLETMASVTGTRWRVEEFFEEGKSYLGMAHYEARAWTSWHHHMSLVGLAHLFVTLTRKRLKHDTADLTLDMALRLLKSALPRPQLTEAKALELLDYYLRRNRRARNSHYKTWRRKHKHVKFKVLL